MEKGQPAFLLAQLGAHAASQFAERLGVLDLTPPDAGILRLLRIAAGLSQQELAAKLKIHPSRLVAILDNLEKRGFVERRANPDDRRLYSLHLAQGRRRSPGKDWQSRSGAPGRFTLRAQQGGARPACQSIVANRRSGEPIRMTGAYIPFIWHKPVEKPWKRSARWRGSTRTLSL